jgi:anaphase-promoting complex subunit 10
VCVPSAVTDRMLPVLPLSAPAHACVLQKLSLYFSYKLDDSYTPAALSVRAGTSPGDLEEVRAVTLDRPDGWITFDVSAEPGDDGEGLCVHRIPILLFSFFFLNFKKPFSFASSKSIHAYILQVIVLANHMNGKDTHVRGMRILGPVE